MVWGGSIAGKEFAAHRIKRLEANVRYEIAVVPPGGGETDYSIVVEQADHVPAVGEYLLVTDTRDKSKQPELAAFRVLYVVTGAKYVSDGHAVQDSVVVQAEVISHPYQGPQHEKVVEMYRSRAYQGRKAPEEFPESGY